MHGDLCSPVTPDTPRGQRFFLLLVDDVSCYMWAVLLDTKVVAADAIKQLWRRSAAYEGVPCHYSAPYTP